MASMGEVQHHYDAGNELFALFLDHQYRVYSCGVWDGVTTLEAAQEQKLRRMTDYAGVAAGHSVLDIGCGWGGGLDYCIRTRMCLRAVGLTLSSKQERYIKERALAGTEVHLCSYADFRSAELFDAVISIGALEHFASLDDYRANRQIEVYREFFRCCSALSTDAAGLGLQTIAVGKRPDTMQSRRDTHYLLQRVFPGSVLPHIGDLLVAAHGYYEPSELRTIGPFFFSSRRRHTRC